MTFLITGSVWAADVSELGDTITVGGATVSKPSSAEQGTSKNIVAMGQEITYDVANTNNKNLVLLGKKIHAEGNRLVYIGTNISSDLNIDDIKQQIINYINNPSGTLLSNNANLVAIGAAINISGKNSVGIGVGVDVKADNSVAIGSGSEVATGEHNTVSFGRTYELNGVTKEITRTLTHVTAGTKTTDAVNYGQVKPLEEKTQNISATIDVTTFKGKINVTDSASVQKDLGVHGNAYLAGNVDISKDLNVSKNANIQNDLGVHGNAYVTGQLTAADGNFKVDKDSGSITTQGSATVQQDLGVHGNAYLAGNVDISKDLNVSKNANIQNDLGVHGNAYVTGQLTAADGNFKVDKDSGSITTQGSATVQQDLGVHGDAYIGSGNNGQTVIRDNTSGYSEIIVNQNAINQVLINENGIKVGKNSSVMDTNGVYAGGDTFDQAKAAISATGELKGASGKFQVTSDGNTTITGILDVTSTSGQFAVKDDYVATRVTRGTSNNATTAGSINTGSFIGERVKNSDGSEFTATGKNTDGIINVAYKDGIYTDVLQTSSGIKVITKSANDNTFGSQTDIGTKITGTDVSIEDPKNTSNRIYLSDVGQVKNVDAELKANSNYVDSPTVVGAINAETDIRRAQFAKLGNKIEKVGAGAAALAAMHPLDFDPDDKLQFSAGVGNYGGETATALGAFYRPTEKVMFNIAGTMGNDENMMNAGITFALDGRNNVSNSRVAMAREIQDLRAQVAQLTNNQAQMMALLNKVLDGQADELLANVMFPDVPKNHWTYEYLDSLQKRGIIKGYPGGSFGGDRSLTRYEYATILCRVLDQGISIDTRLLDEFEAELGRIRIDRIKGKDDSANKIERVRVNSSSDRDDYGSQIINTSAPTTN